MDLTTREFELLAYLCRHVNRVLSRDQLLEHVWGYDFAGDTRIVDVHISHLREKIEQNPKSPEYIKTVRGIGYKLVKGRRPVARIRNRITLFLISLLITALFVAALCALNF
ncbi:hypothetical protein GCM10025857_14190 [Alicyclobacillus contaminans]|nr:hypothetical protein GCM10025857_14190 [Alicyclobacillus contaminans]